MKKIPPGILIIATTWAFINLITGIVTFAMTNESIDKCMNPDIVLNFRDAQATVIIANFFCMAIIWFGRKKLIRYLKIN